MFRKSKRLTKAPTADASPPPRAMPSLPHLSSPTLDWPDNFVASSRASVDRSVAGSLGSSYVHVSGSSVPRRSQSAFATKTSFSSPEQQAVPSFHRPFRTTEEPGPISTSYAGHTAGRRGAGKEALPPSAFRKSVNIDANRRKSHRRQRATPTFNLMVCGAKGSGKTSLLRLILDSADLSPSATHDQRAAVERFLRGAPKSTEHMDAVCVEIAESRTERVLLSVVDTPGFDFEEGRELRLERQVGEVMKYVDTLYAETMGEESKVVRQSKNDQHIHLCIYMLDSTSLVPLNTPPTPDPDPPSALSSSTLSTPLPPSSPTEDDEQAPLTLRPAELRVLQRLSRRLNVVPVFGRADALTEDALVAAKNAVRSALVSARVDLGLFNLPEDVPPLPTRPTSDEGGTATPPINRTISFASSDASGASSTEQDDRATLRGLAAAADADSTSSSEEAPQVIKLRRPSRTTPRVRRSRSRSRIRLDEDEEDEIDPDSVPAVRFGAMEMEEPGALVPYAVVAPERGRPKSRAASERPARKASFNASADAPPLLSRSPARARTPSTTHQPPEVDALRGVFVRRFHWGAADALDPAHCDFPALRAAILTKYSARLRVRTREVLYERYRTERLLARRATGGLGREDAERLLRDLGLLESSNAKEEDEGVGMDIGTRISSILDYNEARLAA